MIDINKEIFRRLSPVNKRTLVNKLTEDELFYITKPTILRIIKEAGVGRNSNQKKNKFKTLYLTNRIGNNWNSNIESIYNWKNDTIFADVYVQGDDTDTNDECPIEKILSPAACELTLGRIEESFNNGYSHSKPANYSKSDRANIIREILNSYIHNKYNI